MSNFFDSYILSLPQNTLIIPAVGIIILLFILYLKEYLTRQNLQKRSDKFLEEARQQSFQLIHQAIKKAQEIESEAELNALKVTAGNKIQSQKMTETFNAYLTSLEETAKVSTTQNETSLKTHTNEFFEKFEQNLSNFLTSTQAQSTKALNLEMAAARNLIETYKLTQLKLVDENILAILERTLSLVLVKKLSLQDQMELVWESLERAKVEKFIG